MTFKILEKKIEPKHIEVGNKFKIKIKAIRYMIYGEMKKETILNLKKYTVSNLKGD